MLATCKTSSRAINTISKHLSKTLLLSLKEKKHQLQLLNKSSLKSLLLLLLRSTTKTRELKSTILMRRKL